MPNLHGAVTRRAAGERSNVHATAVRHRVRVAAIATTVVCLLALSAREGYAQRRVGLFLAGAAVGLGAHEGGHLLFDVVFDADPGIRKVDFHGIPFFALTHRDGLSPKREFVISSAGFWVQHAGNEWLLTTRRQLRRERAPLLKGMFAFNVLASMAYSTAAFARTGPVERDTRGMAVSLGAGEPWIGALILGPAVLDSWRYFDADAEAPVWLSRALKIGAVLLIFNANRR